MSTKTPKSSDDHGLLQSPTFLVAGAFLAIVIVLGVVLAVTQAGSSGTSSHQADAPDSSSHAATPAASPHSATPSAHSKASAGMPGTNGSICGLKAGDQSVPTTTPTGITWSKLDTVALPSSKADGPGIVKNGVARCFADNPVGALIAVSQINYRIVLPGAWRRAVESNVLAGPSRTTYITQMETDQDHGGPYGQLVGFSFVNYSPHSAVITVATKFPQGYESMTEQLTWSGGDWKLKLQPDGAGGTDAHQSTTPMNGFIHWGMN